MSKRCAIAGCENRVFNPAHKICKSCWFLYAKDGTPEWLAELYRLVAAEEAQEREIRLHEVPLGEEEVTSRHTRHKNHTISGTEKSSNGGDF